MLYLRIKASEGAGGVRVSGALGWRCRALQPNTSWEVEARAGRVSGLLLPLGVFLKSQITVSVCLGGVCVLSSPF